MKKVKVSDIARLCSCSNATVSRALNNQPFVEEKQKEMILECARKLGYNHKPRKEHLYIFVPVPTILHSFYQAVIAELQKQCRLNGDTLVLLDNDLTKHQLRLIKSVHPTAVILLDENYPEVSFHKMQQAADHVLFCGCLSLNRSCSSVHINDMQAAYEGMNWILREGHREVAILADQLDSYGSSQLRLAGCKRALSEYGVSLDKVAIVTKGTSFDVAYSNTKFVLSTKPTVTAFFCLSADAAAGCCAALDDCLLQVPSQCSVLGFDGVSVRNSMNLRISSVAQPIAKLVEKTLQLLHQKADDPTAIHSIEVEYELIDRGTLSSIRRI